MGTIGPFERIPPQTADGLVHVVVECPRGSRAKVEDDPALGVFALDRAPYSAVHFPADDGFVPGTRAADGDPLAALVLAEEPTFPGCLVRVRPLGVPTVAKGERREPQLLGVPAGEPRCAELWEVADVPAHVRQEIAHCFEVSKELEGDDLAALGWDGAAQARAALAAAVAAAARPGG
jgi:inorganic pyrophosphatase